MTKILFIVFFSTFIIALSATDIFACRCFSKSKTLIEQEVKDAYAKSSSVFVGKVVEVSQTPDVHSIIARFEVEKTWNKKFQKEITITTGQGGGDCGFNFEIGKRYLVYANSEKAELRTSICTRTALIEKNEDVAVLNKIKKPKTKLFLK